MNDQFKQWKRNAGEWRMRGTMASVKKRRENAISKRYIKGERPSNSYELAKLMDDLYANKTNYVKRYHPEKWKKLQENK